MTYAPVIAALLAALLVGWIGDLVTGRRGIGGTMLVAAVGAACGWFLAQRVFGVGLIDDWSWVLWSIVGAVLSLATFLVFRRKR